MSSATAEQLKVNALCFAAAGRQMSRVVAYLDEGVNVNAYNSFGRTALMLAAFANCRELVDLLLIRGARHDLADFDGETAESIAAQYGHLETAAYLAKWPEVRHRRLQEAKEGDAAQLRQNETRQLAEQQQEKLKTLRPPKSALKRKIT